MIYVCDAIMGSGKTSSTINLFNENRRNKFIYITPYLTESERIKNGCPDLKFVEPSDKMKMYGYKKSVHTAALIKSGKNITTTHQAFKGYTRDMLVDIQRQGYTLVIDENVDVLEKYKVSNGDLRMAIEAGYIADDNGEYSLTDKKYSGVMLLELFRLMRSRKLIKLDDGDDDDLFYWALPPELITSFKDVYVLTYLFDGQSLHHFFQMNNLTYERIGIVRSGDNEYHFGEYPGYTPEYVSHIKDKIHIIENDRMNKIGDDFYALSLHWYEKGGDDQEQIKSNMMNYFNNIARGVPTDQKLFGTYKSAEAVVKGKGYSRRFLTFNTKATNNYKNCSHLAYVANIFMDVNVKLFYESHGINVDEDMYALSVMVQWIWRSAIREGNDIYLYMPSRRMRMILKNWMEDLSKGA